MAKTSMRLDEGAVDKLLHGRPGAVNRVMGGFASLATTRVRDVARERVQSHTGRYLRGVSSKVDSNNRVTITADAPYSSYLEQGTPPHVIRGNPVLVFEWKGQTQFFRFVNHPGTKPYNILRDGVRRAGRELNRLSRRG